MSYVSSSRAAWRLARTSPSPTRPAQSGPIPAPRRGMRRGRRRLPGTCVGRRRRRPTAHCPLGSQVPPPAAPVAACGGLLSAACERAGPDQAECFRVVNPAHGGGAGVCGAACRCRAWRTRAWPSSRRAPKMARCASLRRSDPPSSPG